MRNYGIINLSGQEEAGGMSQIQGSALLKPMRADSLLRPDAPWTVSAVEKHAVAPVQASSSPLMHPPVFAPRPASVRQSPPEHADELDRLWENLDWLQAEASGDAEELEENDEDAVPTDQMPVPVPVPLEMVLPARTRRRTRWVCLSALAALTAVGCVLWRLDWLPF